MEILYSILITAMCMACAFGGFILGLKVKGQERRFVPFQIGQDDEVEEIQRRAFTEPFNIEEPPTTAEGFAQRFRRRSASEDLKRGTRLEDATGV